MTVPFTFNACQSPPWFTVQLFVHLTDGETEAERGRVYYFYIVIQFSAAWGVRVDQGVRGLLKILPLSALQQQGGVEVWRACSYTAWEASHSNRGLKNFLPPPAPAVGEQFSSLALQAVGT